MNYFASYVDKKNDETTISFLYITKDENETRTFISFKKDAKEMIQEKQTSNLNNFPIDVLCFIVKSDNVDVVCFKDNKFNNLF